MSEDAASATVLSTESTATLRQIYDRSRLEQYATKRLLAGGLLMSDNGAAWKRARDLRTSRWSCSAAHSASLFLCHVRSDTSIPSTAVAQFDAADCQANVLLGRQVATTATRPNDARSRPWAASVL